jgi:predicted MPP superfamily phosphohydrolase
VRVPFFGRPVIPSHYGERFAAGHIVEDGRHMFVGTGLGTSILPVRFRVPPEISILTIRS